MRVERRLASRLQRVHFGYMVVHAEVRLSRPIAQVVLTLSGDAPESCATQEVSYCGMGRRQ